ncbi:unnamed protein product [Rhizoctonia solani]|uniref:Peptidase C14 caspase domain-containing protein n=1 Tax=Rhizoctonia solani TaxID=456999 RepID=A0A8H3I4D1_9AGAM|nr:unnamed protein product [Rhizoctonia solani]
MLLKHGYEQGNIRILVARAGNTTQYKCQPTKKNIMKSLAWLVQGARKGDYRYFHFSGHGEVFESSTGKVAREIPKDRGKGKSRAKPSLTSVQSLKTEVQQQAPQPELEAVHEESEQHIPGGWIHASPAVALVPKCSSEAEAERRAQLQSALWKELGDAIRNGDSMPTSPNKATYKAKGEVKRRALLVGGQYETDTRNTYLSGTPIDILNIYRMLLKHGYEKGNIRILVARAGNTTQYKCQPTKKNIMKSLAWLVQGARKEDYRYFHYNNFKLLGAGFRGSMVPDGNDLLATPLTPTCTLPTTHDTFDHPDPEISKGVIMRNGSNQKLTSAVQITFPPQLPLHVNVESEEFRTVDVLEEIEPLQNSRGLITFASSVYQYFSPPRAVKIRMEDELPDEELRRDKIVADMLTWGGCHQRQFAGEFDEESWQGGYFTSSFFEAVNDISKDQPIKVRELFENVNTKLADKMDQCMRINVDILEEQAHGSQDSPDTTPRDHAPSGSGVRGSNPGPQYIQLWTSLGNSTKHSANAKLDHFFVI